MKYIADLHIHSLYSRATSKASHLHGLAAWAAIKGIGVVGTGDFTHPGWFAHLHQYLEPAEPGFFRLKPDPCFDFQALMPAGIHPATSPFAIRFVLSAEVSSIYKRGGKVRKVHNLLYAPDFESVQRVNATLARLGNIASDGRPILGLDSRDLLEILLEKAPEGFLVPAHIWTPWFSLFGSKSGFDSIEECFGDLSEHIFALETGLSSDPEMNRLISSLDRCALISNSDCHSPAKLGREANIFTTGFDYFSMREALRAPVNGEGEQVFAATVEFFPEEGKYHCDGHRNCGVCLQPEATRQVNGLCPGCGKPLTIGVLHRVMELADRPQAVYPSGSPTVHSLIPLQEIVAELCGTGPASKKALEGYVRLINTFGSEFALLLDTPGEAIRAKGLPLVAEAIERVRENRVIRQPGYDGEFGVIKVFSAGERATLCGQGRLFGPLTAHPPKKAKDRNQLALTPKAAEPAAAPVVKELNSEQQQAVVSEAALILVQAGPGTGKTHTLVSRVLRTAAVSNLPCTVITFTNKAAAEVRARLQEALSDAGATLTVATFHGYCLAQLRRSLPDLQVAGPEERAAVFEALFPELSEKARGEISRNLSVALRLAAEPPLDPEVTRYFQVLAERSLIDIEAVVPRTVSLLQQGGAEAAAIRAATGHLFVDEFQDINQAQYTLITLLAQTATVFAIGDPDQAIYGFRGSDPKWFHAFIREYQPECHQLVRNYRSGSRIVHAAEQLIAHNPHPRPVAAMHPCSLLPGAIQVQSCASPDQEAVFIADQIELQLGGTSHRSLDHFDSARTGKVSFRDIGVLYRTSRQAEALSTVLTARGIPFQLVNLEAYYTKGDCRLLYYWMLLLAGTASTGQQFILLEQEKGIGKQSLQHLHDCLPSSVPKIQTDLVFSRNISLDGTAAVALERFRALYGRMLALASGQPVATVLLALMDYYHLDPQDAEMLRLRELAMTFGDSLVSFADHLQSFSDSIVYDAKTEAVTLSTLHAAKGLEFSVVFIAGVEEGLVPLTPRQQLESTAWREHLEEERRLFYVGMTRAVAILYLTWCAARASYSTPGESRKPSQFLAELPAASLSAPPVCRPAAEKRKPTHRQLSLFS